MRIRLKLTKRTVSRTHSRSNHNSHLHSSAPERSSSDSIHQSSHPKVFRYLKLITKLSYENKSIRLYQHQNSRGKSNRWEKHTERTNYYYQNQQETKERIDQFNNHNNRFFRGGIWAATSAAVLAINQVIQDDDDEKKANAEKLKEDFLKAAENGDLGLLKKCLLENTALIYEAKTDKGSLAIHVAAFYGKLSIVSYLIDYDNNTNVNFGHNDKRNLVNLLGSFNRTALHVAAESGYVEIVQCLLQNGAKIRVEILDKNDDGSPGFEICWTPLHATVCNYNIKNADINKKRIAIIDILISYDVEILGKNKQGITPLYIAAGNIGSIDVVTHLVSKGAQIDGVISGREKDRGWTILYKTLHRAYIDETVPINEKPDYEKVAEYLITQCHSETIEITKALAKEKNQQKIMEFITTHEVNLSQTHISPSPR